MRDINLPMQVFAATDANHFRKPATGMWEHLAKHGNGGVDIDKSGSFYVGDAAGRPKAWKAKMGRDHSAADRKFALNVGVKFYTPEEYFLGEPQYPVSKCAMGFDPKSVNLDRSVKDLETDLGLSDRKKGQEVVVMVGFPASGKTTIAKRYFVDQLNYVHINRDTLKDAKRCIKAARDALEQGKSVIVDNTTPDVASRKPYIDMAKELNVPSRCLWMQTSIDLSKHLNMMREVESKGARKHVPNVAYNVFNKKFVQPRKEEGFSKVTPIEWTPLFETDEQKQLFLQWTE